MRKGAPTWLGSRLAAVMLCLAGLVLPRGGANAEPRRDWPGAFQGDYGFFFGGGVGGGLARTKRPDEQHSRYATLLPLNLRAGFDLGRFGLAALLDLQYSFLWGPHKDQGPRPANRAGTMQMLSVAGSVLWRPVGPLYLSVGAGVALPSSGQELFGDVVPARVELVTSLGFIYRMPRKEEDSQRGSHYPFGMSVSIETRYYVPWDERFMNYSIQAAVTFYFVWTAR